MNQVNADILAALKAANGYMLNAKIDLETGALKRTAIQTIEGGLKVIRSAIAKAETTANCGSCETVLSELVAHVQGVLDGDYKLDDATLRPARELLAGRAADIRAAASAVRKRAGCFGGPAIAECTDMSPGGNCDCAEFAREIVAALTASPHAVEREWQPIETAPKGKIIILFAATDIGENGEVKNWKMATGCRHSADDWQWEGRQLATYDIQPTHWMPLPAAPVPAEQRDER